MGPLTSTGDAVPRSAPLAQRPAPIDIGALLRAMPVLKAEGTPGRGHGLAYFVHKQRALLAFYRQCLEGSVDTERNPLLTWIEGQYGPEPYRGTTSRPQRVDLCRRYRALFEAIREHGVREPLILEGPIPLPGVLDGGNRLAVIRVLGYSRVVCALDADTLALARRLEITS
jgi:hypothetical protein